MSCVLLSGEATLQLSEHINQQTLQSEQLKIYTPVLSMLMIIFLLICGLFNGTISISDYIALNNSACLCVHTRVFYVIM
jgi:uncharacterized membrane protein YiaA